MLTFEQTLEQLHAWLGRRVAVSVNPATVGSMPMQVAMFFGGLNHAEEPPPHVRIPVPGSPAEFELFAFFVGEERRNHFMISPAFFISGELQQTSLGEELLAITMPAVRVLVLLEPNS